MTEHKPSCRWQQTTEAECEYRATHHYCPHAEHACTCGPAEAKAALRDGDDLTHYANAAARLSQENAVLREHIRELKGTVKRVEAWRAMTALDSDQDATLLAALRPNGSA